MASANTFVTPPNQYTVLKEKKNYKYSDIP